MNPKQWGTSVHRCAERFGSQRSFAAPGHQANILSAASNRRLRGSVQRAAENGGLQRHRSTLQRAPLGQGPSPTYRGVLPVPGGLSSTRTEVIFAGASVNPIRMALSSAHRRSAVLARAGYLALTALDTNPRCLVERLEFSYRNAGACIATDT
jgi:hypothetical protein